MSCASACPCCTFSVLDSATVPPSPHPELLSDTLPSDSEAASIQTAIDTSEQNILAIEEEMTRLGKALNECSARRRELREFAYTQRSAFSPFRRLPSELLAEIFLQCREQESSWGLRSNSEWVVAQVCGRWRAVALSTPSLWADIEVSSPSLGYRGSMSEKLLVSLLSLQIERSRQHPLSLRYLAAREFSPDTRRSILELFLSVAHRWLDVCLNLTNEDLQRLNRFNRGFPLLSKFKICTWGSRGPHRKNFPRLPAVATPRFSHPDLPSHPLPHLLKISWAQLKTCVLLNSPSDVLMILQRTSSIVDISIYDDGLLGPDSPTPELDHDLVSRLKPGNPGPHIPGFLTRSRCPLTHLTLRYTGLPSSALLEILVLTPELTHLVAHGEDLTFSDLIVGGLAHASLARRLTSLSLSGRFTCTNDRAVEMLRGRSGDSGALRVARLIPVYGSPLIPCIDELRDVGLDLGIDEPAATNLEW
ncbi:hypothetical protein DFH09DRAFT_1367649 [Mycena vulgaris]|nr:hypothetical protein DFH09DRAFT_1367649 [Mycena vulgaris]